MIKRKEIGEESDPSEKSGGKKSHPLANYIAS